MLQRTTNVLLIMVVHAEMMVLSKRLFFFFLPSKNNSLMINVVLYFVKFLSVLFIIAFTNIHTNKFIYYFSNICLIYFCHIRYILLIMSFISSWCASNDFHNYKLLSHLILGLLFKQFHFRYYFNWTKNEIVLNQGSCWINKVQIMY